MEEATLERLKSEFQELFDHLTRLPNAEEIFQEMQKLTDDFERACNHIDVLFKLGKRGVKQRKEFSLFSMPVFLWIFEGQYVNRLDLACLILIANGHDLFNPIKRQYVSSLEDIGEVDISTKFKFLERHKLEILIRKQDQRLRNKIAIMISISTKKDSFQLMAKWFIYLQRLWIYSPLSQRSIRYSWQLCEK